MAICKSISDDYEDSNLLQLPALKGVLFHYTPNILIRCKYNAQLSERALSHNFKQEQVLNKARKLY